MAIPPPVSSPPGSPGFNFELSDQLSHAIEDSDLKELSRLLVIAKRTGNLGRYITAEVLEKAVPKEFSDSFDLLILLLSVCKEFKIEVVSDELFDKLRFFEAHVASLDDPGAPHPYKVFCTVLLDSYHGSLNDLLALAVKYGLANLVFLLLGPDSKIELQVEEWRKLQKTAQENHNPRATITGIHGRVFNLLTTLGKNKVVDRRLF